MRWIATFLIFGVMLCGCRGAGGAMTPTTTVSPQVTAQEIRDISQVLITIQNTLQDQSQRMASMEASVTDEIGEVAGNFTKLTTSVNKSYGLDQERRILMESKSKQWMSFASRIAVSAMGLLLLLLVAPSPFPSTSIYGMICYSVAFLMLAGPWIVLAFRVSG